MAASTKYRVGADRFCPHARMEIEDEFIEYTQCTGIVDDAHHHHNCIFQQQINIFSILLQQKIILPSAVSNLNTIQLYIATNTSINP